MAVTVRFFEGGVTAEYLDNLPIPELLKWVEKAGELGKRIKAETDRQRTRGRHGF